jgi:CDP-diacylglycerol--glycerol-3-phosphate 3-phosphatidyltransferase
LNITLPLALTFARIGAIPLVLALFYLPAPYARQVATVVFVFAGITDWVDGWLARRWNQTSAFGAFLDPVADKLLVATCLIMLLWDEPSGLLALLVTVIIGREIAVSALREWMAELGSRNSVSVSWIGKLKTGFQMTAIGMMIWQIDVWALPIYLMGYALLVVAAVLTMYSMMVYLRAAWPMMRDGASDVGSGG